MKTAMKKVLSLTLVLVLLLSVFPMAAFAEEADGGIATADIGNMLPRPEDQNFDIPAGPDGEQDNKPTRPGFGGNDGRPGPGERPNPDPAPAPTSLTVKFYIDNELKETVTHNAAATVLELIQNCCKVDDTVTVNYSGARVENTPYDLGDVVALGEEVHIYLYTEQTVVTPTPDENPRTCSQCGKRIENGMCKGCSLDEADCTCANCKECGAPAGEHLEVCSKHPDYEKHRHVELTLNYNYHGAPRNTKMSVDRNAKLIDIIAGIPAPTRDGHLFSHWTLDQEGNDTIEDERVTDKGTVIYAQWDDNLALGGKYTVRVNLNYDRKMGEPLTNIARGTRMGDVLDYIDEPTRWNYKFVGWYWDDDCEDAVKSSDKVTRNCEIYAKWERRNTNNEIMLKIYVNGNTKSVAKIVDMYEYSKDGKISLSEVKEVVAKYYTAKNSNGLSYDGLFEADEWSKYVSSRKHVNGDKYIDVNRYDDTTVYVMVNNATARTASSSSTADSSNPKTGDMIFMSATVLGLSASALAVLFYLNKKRSV